MAQAFRIDTLAFSKKLRDAGADERLAEAIVEGITSADTSELATKADLAELRSEISARFADLYKQQWVMAAGIVGLTVTLIKLLP